MNVKTSYSVGKQIGKCVSCKKDAHPIYRCERFLDKSPRERFEFVKKNKLRVLGPVQSGHSCSSCTSITSKFACSCNEPHNYLLHFGSAKADATLQNLIKKKTHPLMSSPQANRPPKTKQQMCRKNRFRVPWRRQERNCASPIGLSTIPLRRKNWASKDIVRLWLTSHNDCRYVRQKTSLTLLSNQFID